MFDRKKMLKIAKALECGCASMEHRECHCESCDYWCVEELPKEYEAMADFIEDGKPYCRTCDVDRIGLDAAKVLREIAGGGVDIGNKDSK